MPRGSPELGLTPRAVIGRAAGKYDGRYFCSTTRASPAPFAVRDEEGSWQAIGKPLCSGSGVNRCLQYALHAAEQALLRVRAKSVGARPGMDAGLKQDLVGIDVANPRDHRLIHQKRLHIALAANERPLKGCKIKPRIERIGAEPLFRNKCVSVGR